MSDIFHVRVRSRLFRVTITGVLVDVRDVKSTFETQAITESALLGHDATLADSQVRDAFRSVYHNALWRENGEVYPSGDALLPGDFIIERGRL